jgi:anti-sigma regulatory factor (Ser/Thr protein kinase)
VGALSIVDHWLAGWSPLRVLDEASVVLAGARARHAAAALPPDAQAAFVTAVTELARNQIAHAAGGWMDARPLATGGAEAILADGGKGLVEPGRALRGEIAEPRGLGAGFAGAYRLVDELDLDARRGEGTCVRVRKHPTAPARRREVAILAVPYPGEARCGDQAVVAWTGAGVRFLVADGVGHGEPARDAADLAAQAFAELPGAPVDELVRACDERLRGSRGAALLAGVATGRAFDHVSLGNIEVAAIGRDARPFGGRHHGVAGSPRRPPGRFVVERTALADGDALAVWTDGIPAHIALPVGVGHQPALAVAEAVMALRRGDDDALVLVIKT